MEIPFIYRKPFTLRRIHTISVFNTKSKKFEYNIITDRRRNHQSIKVAVEQVANIDFSIRCRKTDVVNARRVYLFLAYNLCRISTTELGKTVGLNHSSVIVSNRKCESYIQADDKATILLLSEVCEFLNVKFVINNL